MGQARNGYKKKGDGTLMLTYEGIVIGKRDIGDNSCFIDILTDEMGLIEVTAHGAKKLNSSLLSSTSLFSYSVFCLSKTRDRYTLNSAKPKYSFHELGNDIEKLALASYFAQAIKYCTPQEQLQLYLTKESFVKFLAYALYEITNASPRAAGQENEKLRTLENIRSTFELRYSCMMGYIPNLVGCSNCGKYESEHMVFLPEFAEIICGECFDWSYDGEYTDLMPDTLWCMRNIIYAAADKCFKFGTTAAVEKQLSAFTENYFLNKTERTFGALNYYKSLSDNR